MGVKGARAGVRTDDATRAQSLKEPRDIFLGHFAANCNVTAAAAAADTPVDTLYLWRRTEPEFAAQWSAALAGGYEILEARLLEHALAGGPRSDETILAGVPGTAIAPLNIELGLKLLSNYRPGKAEQVRRGRAPVVPVTRETMMAELLMRLDVIEQRKRASAQRKAAQATARKPAGTAKRGRAVRGAQAQHAEQEGR